MLTAKLVVAARPFQVVLTCAAIIIAGLDQQYRNSQTRLLVILAGGVPATLLSISVAIQTIWGFVGHHDYSHRARTVRWVVDFFTFLLLGALIPILLIIDCTYPNGHEPPFPFALLWLIVDAVATFLFFVTWVALAVEDVLMRKTRPLLVEVSSKYTHSRSDTEDTSNEVQSFYSRFGSISRPTLLNDPLTHLGPSSRQTLLDVPLSRFSAYSSA